MKVFNISNFVKLKILSTALVTTGLQYLLVVVFCEARLTKVSSAAKHFPRFYYTGFLSSNFVILFWEYY